MEIVEQRAEAVRRIKELQKIKPKVYTASELHQRRQMMGRVQRQEQKRYHQAVREQKLKLRKDVTDIDFYLKSLPKEPKGQVFAIQSVVPAPQIVFGKKPKLRETRIRRYKRGGRF